MTAKFLPLNIRIRILDMKDAKGRLSIMVAIPNPGNKETVQANPAILEIALVDPDDGKEKWYEVPFAIEEKSVIQVN